jgi:hypothetical protein
MWWSDPGGSFNSTPASPLLSDEAETIIGLTANLEWDQIHRQGDQILHPTRSEPQRSRRRHTSERAVSHTCRRTCGLGWSPLRSSNRPPTRRLQSLRSASNGTYHVVHKDSLRGGSLSPQARSRRGLPGATPISDRRSIVIPRRQGCPVSGARPKRCLGEHISGRPTVALEVRSTAHSLKNLPRGRSRVRPPPPAPHLRSYRITRSIDLQRRTVNYASSVSSDGGSRQNVFSKACRTTLGSRGRQLWSR